MSSRGGSVAIKHAPVLMRQDERACSFCALNETRVETLVFGPGSVAICDQCLELCEEIIAEDTTGYAPDDQRTGLFGRFRRRYRGLACSFCSKDQQEVRKLIAGPEVHVCDECVGRCGETINQESWGRTR